MRIISNVMRQALSGAVLVWLAWPTGALAVEQASYGPSKAAARRARTASAKPARHHDCFENPKFGASLRKRHTDERQQ